MQQKGMFYSKEKQKFNVTFWRLNHKQKAEGPEGCSCWHVQVACNHSLTETFPTPWAYRYPPFGHGVKTVFCVSLKLFIGPCSEMEMIAQSVRETGTGERCQVDVTRQPHCREWPSVMLRTKVLLQNFFLTVAILLLAALGICFGLLVSSGTRQLHSVSVTVKQ